MWNGGFAANLLIAPTVGKLFPLAGTKSLPPFAREPIGSPISRWAIRSLAGSPSPRRGCVGADAGILPFPAPLGAR